MYVNSRVIITNLTDEQIKEKLKIYHFVGYQELIIDFDYSPDLNFHEELEKIRKLTDLQINGKIIFRPKSINDLKNKISNFNKFKKLAVAIESNDKDILSFSANDSRIDIISFSTIENIKNISEGIVSLIHQNAKYIEISLVDAFRSKGFERSKTFREIKKILDLLKGKEENLLLSTGGKNLEYIRGPKEIISIMNALFEIPLQTAKKFVRENPLNLLKKIEDRNDPNIFESGFKIVTDQNDEI